MISPEQLPQWMNGEPVHPIWMPIRQRMLEMDQKMGFPLGTFENHDVFDSKDLSQEAFDRAGPIRRQHMIDTCTLLSVARNVHTFMADGSMFCHEQFTHVDADGVERNERMGSVAKRMVPIFEL